MRGTPTTTNLQDIAKSFGKLRNQCRLIPRLKSRDEKERRLSKKGLAKLEMGERSKIKKIIQEGKCYWGKKSSTILQGLSIIKSSRMHRSCNDA